MLFKNIYKEWIKPALNFVVFFGLILLVGVLVASCNDMIWGETVPGYDGEIDRYFR